MLQMNEPKRESKIVYMDGPIKYYSKLESHQDKAPVTDLL